MALASVTSPTTGPSSIFQSPVWNTVPSGVRMARPFGSAIEWVMVIMVTLNGPRSIVPFSGTSWIFTWFRMPASRSFSRIRKAVNGVA
jgi:hypothetical protein